ncbi:MAG: ATP-binding protein [Planctomycetota bacterium]
MNGPEIQRTVVLALSDPTVSHAFARILDLRGHRAFVADSMYEVIESDAFDVLVGEFGLPARSAGVPMDEIVVALRALGHDPVTVALANEPSDRDLQAILDLDVEEILNRPLLPERLIEVVEEVRERGAEIGEDSHAEVCELEIEVGAFAESGEATARELIAWCVRCEIVPPTRARIGSAVSEAVENAVDAGAHSIRLRARLTPSTLEIVIEDDGPGFDAVDAITRGATDASTGIGRMHCLAESVSIQSTQGEGSSVTLGFRVTVTEFEEEFRIDLTDLDFFVPATSKELLATLAEDPDAPVVLSPALAVVIGRLLMGPRPSSLATSALRASTIR